MKRPAERRTGWITSPEAIVGVLAIVACAASAIAVPGFLDADYLLDRSSLYIEIGLMALAMTFVIGAGQIDLSCASILALTGTLVMTLDRRFGLPPAGLLLAGPAIGAAFGALNGGLVARLGLPSLVVTLGTMAAFRGIAQVLVGDHSIPAPEWFAGADRLLVGDSFIPVPFAGWLAAAAVAAAVLHKSLFGQRVLAVGAQPLVARYAGIPADRVVFACFVLSGAVSGVAGMLLASRLGVARYDNGLGMELDVVTVVVLGGAQVTGGRATILGTVLALVLLATIQTGMGVANIKAEYQTAASGALLVLAALASRGLAAWQKSKANRPR